MKNTIIGIGEFGCDVAKGLSLYKQQYESYYVYDYENKLYSRKKKNNLFLPKLGNSEEYELLLEGNKYCFVSNSISECIYVIVEEGNNINGCILKLLEK